MCKRISLEKSKVNYEVLNLCKLKVLEDVKVTKALDFLITEVIGVIEVKEDIVD